MYQDTFPTGITGGIELFDKMVIIFGWILKSNLENDVLRISCI